MSANNWDICPKCVGEATNEVYAKYGKVPPEEFDRLREGLPTISRENFRTFREDYEIYGAEEGEIRVRYSGRCTQCGLGTKISEDQRFYPETGE